jgi:hypothetical protein
MVSKIMDELLKIDRILLQNNLIFSFCGDIDQKLLELIIEMVKHYQENKSTGIKKNTNMTYIFIELVQNIKNYRLNQIDNANFDKIRDNIVVLVGKNEDGFYISCQNLVEINDAILLKSRLENLSELSLYELNKLYKFTRNKEIDPSKKGSGLGLIEVFRKVGKVEFLFSEYDELFSIFTVYVVV